MSPDLETRLRRLWPFLLALAAIVTYAWVLYDPYQIDGDAVNYMDLSDLIRTHQWAGVVNGYWHPFYPALLALGQMAFHSTRLNELHAFYVVNFGIFLLQLAAIIAFADALIALRTQREQHRSATVTNYLFSRTTLRTLAVALLLIASQRELSIGKVRPDALLQALLLFGLAALLRNLASGLLRYAALMGLAFGFAYLTKSFAFLFTLLAICTLIAFRALWQRHRLTHIAASAVLAGVCFGVVAGPYIAALSQKSGRFDFGDSGALNYAWFVGGTEKMHLEPDMTDRFGSADVRLKHPEVKLPVDLPVYSYAAVPYGTYPDWFDTTYFNDGVKPLLNLRGEISRSARDLALVARYVLNHPEAIVLLLVLLLLGAHFSLPGKHRVLSIKQPHRSRWGISSLLHQNAFWLPPVLLAAALWSIYGLVNIEERYVTVGFLALLLPAFAALRFLAGDGVALKAAQPQHNGSGLAHTACAALTLLLFLLAIGDSIRQTAELRRQQSITTHAPGWYDPQNYEAAAALARLGIRPGDQVACIGTQACLRDYYWARLAGVRVLTEIYDQDKPVDAFLATYTDEQRTQAYTAIRAQGAKAIVGSFDPARMTGRDPVSAGWLELGDHNLYALPLQQ